MAEDKKGEQDIPLEEKPKEEAISTFTYSPESCDFEVVLPSEPYSSRRCDELGKNCYNITSFTQVYDMKTTVDINLSCNPSTPKQFQSYNEAVMRTAMKGMIGRNNLNDTQIGYQDQGDVRIANLSGTGTAGRQSQIYIAQLWSSEGSIMTLEANLIGEAHPNADKAFSEILRSIEHKPKKRPTPEKQKKDFSEN